MSRGAPARAAAAGGRWWVPEVVQVSSMDCGPAALASVLGGYGIAASLGRLREACQTSIDGTSIDTLEEVAQQLGLRAEQVVVPADHVALPDGRGLPAIVVVQHADLGAHFIVVWRRVGDWVQVMDPAAGRQWLRVRTLRAQLYRHAVTVDAADWQAWAASDENRDALAARMHALGIAGADAQRLLADTAASAACAGWMHWAALDGALRRAASLVEAGGLRRGAEALRLVQAGLARAAAAPDRQAAVQPEPAEDPADAPRLRLHGAVVLRIAGRADTHPLAAGGAALPAELAAVLLERPEAVWRTVWRLLRDDGRGAPALLAFASGVATLAVLLEALLLRGLLDIAARLPGTGQRPAAAAALLGFLLLRTAWEWPTQREALRLARQLDLRLRAALLRRLPRLHDRYFQSRPISDMADRAHGLQGIRALPHTLAGLVQAVCDLLLTAAAVAWLAPAAAAWVLVLAGATLALPLLALPLLREGDLRVRTHAAALAGFTLDALLGLVPVRAHRAERALRREHEALLVQWARALQRWIGCALWLDGLQGLVSLGCAMALLATHFRAQGGVAGSDLLLVFWTLKLPALGRRLAGYAEVLPAQRNALTRLLEPLSAPGSDEPPAPPAAAPASAAGTGWALRIERGEVQAGGHRLLQDIHLQIAAGEQVAVVGVSGAGKSSLIGLLLGWHRLSSGTLQIDGRRLDGADAAAIEALRPQIAWVDPAVQLWNRSLLDNLLYASDDGAIAAVAEATRAARLPEVAARLPEGLQTLLGEGGARLSGGEGQRVRLARALLQTAPRLVLLDEPFRGLDRTQRHALLAEARRWWQGSTLLCVTHDVGETLPFARVLVIEDGRIVEDGAPRVLAARPSRYRALLDAEAALRDGAWGDAAWRRIELRDGRLAEMPPGGAA